MRPETPLRPMRILLATIALAAAGAGAPANPNAAPARSPQTPVPVTAPAPAATPATAPAPASPVRDMRLKLSAGDLLSAESILEVYRAEHGEDGATLVGLSWLARGSLLVGDTDKARRYALEVRARCADSLAHGASLVANHDLETALGAAIEVQAELFARADGARAASDYVRGELGHIDGPEALRVRLNKRIDLMTLENTPAPELVVEDFRGSPPPTLASLKGKPVLLFVWAEWCSDCKSQAAVLAAVNRRYASTGLRIVALTRYYEDAPADRVHEKAAIDSVWNSVYKDVGPVPIVISTASAERYGGSSTPTFVFIDRAGIVRRYTPTRLTLDEFEKTLDVLTR